MRARWLSGLLTMTWLGSCSAVESVQVAMGDLPYRCEDGQMFPVRFDDVTDTALLTLNGRRVTLAHAVSGSGARYTAPDGWELWIKGKEASFTRPGSGRTTCRTTA